MVAASEISEPDWSRVTTNLTINAIAGGGVGGRSAVPYVTVSLGKVGDYTPLDKLVFLAESVYHRAIECPARGRASKLDSKCVLMCTVFATGMVEVTVCRYWRWRWCRRCCC